VIAFCNDVMQQISTAGKLAKIEDIESAVDLPFDWYRDADEVIRQQMIAILKQHEERNVAEIKLSDIAIVNVFVDPSLVPTDLSIVESLIFECKRYHSMTIDSDEFNGGRAIVVWHGSATATEAELIAAVAASDFGSKAGEQLAPGQEPLAEDAPLSQLKRELESLTIDQLRQYRRSCYDESLSDYKRRDLHDLVFELWTGDMEIKPLNKMTKSEMVQESLDDIDAIVSDEDLIESLKAIRAFAV
jgi:hypothetical protein